MSQEKITITVAEYQELLACKEFQTNVAHTGLAEEMKDLFHEICLWAIPHECYKQRAGEELSDHLQLISDVLFCVRKEERRWMKKE